MHRRVGTTGGAAGVGGSQEDTPSLGPGPAPSALSWNPFPDTTQDVVQPLHQSSQRAILAKCVQGSLVWEQLRGARSLPRGGA